MARITLTLKNPAGDILATYTLIAAVRRYKSKR